MICGGREGSATWTDKEGGLWLFGGFGYGKNGSGRGILNDLWVFDREKWEFMGGSSDIDVPSNYSSENPFPGSLYYSQVWQFPNGTVWIYGGQTPKTVTNDFWEWKLTSNSYEWKWLSGSKGNQTKGNYGEKGVPNVNNTLGSRWGGGTAIGFGLMEVINLISQLITLEVTLIQEHDINLSCGLIKMTLFGFLEDEPLVLIS